MANIWQNAVITSKGLALLAKLTQGNTLDLTRAATGAGYVNPTVLYQLTALTGGEKQSLTFRAVSYPETGTCKLPVYLNNNGLNTGYTAMQVGIFADDPDDGEILFFIAQAENSTGTVIPAASEMPGYSAEWTFYFAYGQADSVDVTVDPSNTVSQTEMNEAIDSAIDSHDDDPAAHSAEIAAAISAAASIKRSITIPTTGWATGASEGPTGAYYVDITQSDTTADMVPIISIQPGDLAKARDCGMSTTARAMSGKIRLYAESAPTAAIAAELTLIKASPASGMTNNGYGIINAPSRTEIPYGECSTTGSTQTKVVTINGIFSLKAGLSIRVKFTNAQSYSGQPKLNLNSFGAINIVRNGTTAAAQYEWNAGEVLDLVYDGTSWVIVDGAIASTTYYGLTKLSSSTSSTSTTMAATASAVKAVNDRLTYGTTDKTPGTDSLTTGVIYLVYE